MHETHPEAKQLGPCVLVISTKGITVWLSTQISAAPLLAHNCLVRGLKTFERCPRRRLPHSAVCESRGDARFSAGGHST